MSENITPSCLQKLLKEQRDLINRPAEGIALEMNEDDVCVCHAIITGPAGTPYVGGSFKIRIVFGAEYPAVPPKGFFTTRIFHPNIAKTGDICVNTLKRDWKPDMGLRHILMVIRCLLIEPFPESALNDEAGKLLMEDYEAYASHARMMTSIHAMKKSNGADSAEENNDDDANGENNNNTGAAPEKMKKAKTDKKLEKKRSLKRL